MVKARDPVQEGRKTRRAKLEEGARALLASVHHAAEGEGWDLFNASGVMEIERDDEGGTFDTDTKALQHVLYRAMQGSKPHALALLLDGKLASEVEQFLEQFVE
jgi:hypothetical protein